jgi:hypothetical protein
MYGDVVVGRVWSGEGEGGAKHQKREQDLLHGSFLVTTIVQTFILERRLCHAGGYFLSNKQWRSGMVTPFFSRRAAPNTVGYSDAASAIFWI